MTHELAVAREVVIPIEGMTCASCVARVEKALRGSQGVRKAEVNLALRTARVLVADQGLEPALEAIEDAGYHAAASAESLRTGLSAQDADRAQAEERRSTTLRAAFWRFSARRL